MWEKDKSAARLHGCLWHWVLNLSLSLDDRCALAMCLLVLLAALDTAIRSILQIQACIANKVENWEVPMFTLRVLVDLHRCEASLSDGHLQDQSA